MPYTAPCSWTYDAAKTAAVLPAWSAAFGGTVFGADGGANGTTNACTGSDVVSLGLYRLDISPADIPNLLAVQATIERTGSANPIPDGDGAVILATPDGLAVAWGTLTVLTGGQIPGFNALASGYVDSGGADITPGTGEWADPTPPTELWLAMIVTSTAGQTGDWVNAKITDVQLTLSAPPAPPTPSEIYRPPVARYPSAASRGVAAIGDRSAFRRR